MSDIGAGIPIGMAIGIGAGIGIGKKGAKDDVKKKIREFSETHHISIEGSNGTSVSLDEFIAQVAEQETNKKQMVLILVIGTVLFLLGVVVFFLMK